MGTLTQTFMICHDGSFLMVRRSLDEEYFPGYWAFPGGRVEPGEIPLQSALREIYEETSLQIEDRYVVLDTYGFANRSAYALLFFAKSRNVRLSAESLEFDWVNDIDDLSERKCIEGIYYHLQQAIKTIEIHQKLINFSDINDLLKEINSSSLRQTIDRKMNQKAQDIERNATFRSIEADTLTRAKYPNV